MKTPDIVIIPDPILRQTMPELTNFTPELSQLAQVMLNRMHQADGVGLAANQIGQELRLFVYGIESFDHQGKTYPSVPDQAVINPIIEVIDKTTEEMEEGCLSIPGIVGPVSRPIKVRLSGQDLQGRPFSRIISDYEARVVQHETDHLNGILFLDHIDNPGKIRRAKD